MRLFFLSAFMFVAISFSALGQRVLSTDQKQKLTTLLGEYPISNTPGIAVAVMQHGEIIYKKNQGYANLEHMIPITDSTKFLVASISKQFTAFAILLLEEEGKLSIGDKVSTYLPELGELGDQITIKHFLNHTSGFRNTFDIMSFKGKKFGDLADQEEMVNILLKQKSLNFSPGERFQYCNASFILTAEIIARVSGMSFPKFAQERIFKPLKMQNSLFVDDIGIVVKNKALSYEKWNNNYYYLPFHRSVVGSTGLYTTLEDLGRWANNFDRLTVGSKLIIQKMKTKSHLSSGKQIPYALGQEIKEYKGLEVIFHGGGEVGFRSYLVRVPEHNLSVMVSGNFKAFNPINIAYGLIDVFLADYIKETVKIIPTYTTKELKKYEGNYHIFPGYDISIIAENDTLYFQEYGQESKAPLPVTGENEFIFPYSPQCKFRFFEDSLTWHFSDFYYPGTKIIVPPAPNATTLSLTDYTGVYYSHELETSYEVTVQDNKLVIKHAWNLPISLKAMTKDTFGSPSGHIRLMKFIRNKKGIIESCKISSQDVYDVVFEKR